VSVSPQLATVAGSATATGNNGTVTYTQSTGSTYLTVSSTVPVSTTGTVVAGPYTATGTTSDPNGDSGTFTYTLTVGTITQSAPTTGSVTTTGSATFTHQLAVTSLDHFKFGPPTVTKLTPNSGSITGGTTVTVTGTGFGLGTEATLFKFGTTEATTVNCTSNTSCTVTAPSHVAGIVDVKATVSGQISPKALSDQFTYN